MITSVAGGDNRHEQAGQVVPSAVPEWVHEEIASLYCEYIARNRRIYYGCSEQPEGLGKQEPGSPTKDGGPTVANSKPAADPRIKIALSARGVQGAGSVKSEEVESYLGLGKRPRMEDEADGKPRISGEQGASSSTEVSFLPRAPTPASSSASGSTSLIASPSTYSFLPAQQQSTQLLQVPQIWNAPPAPRTELLPVLNGVTSASLDRHLRQTDAATHFMSDVSSPIEFMARLIEDPDGVITSFLKASSSALVTFGLALVAPVHIVALSLGRKTSSLMSSQQVATCYLHHHVAAVRQAALHCLMRLHEFFGIRYLDVLIYPHVAARLTDDDNLVRKIAIPVVRFFAEMYPNHNVPNAPGIDAAGSSIAADAFARTCDLINDPIVEIRRAATEELGRFTNIDGSALLQTLSKSVLADTHRGNSKNKPDPKCKPWNLSENWKSYAGAFVHAIEDEYQEVRHAALGAIAALSTRHPLFAEKSVFFLLDMTNDEVRQIRENAVRVLHQIGRTVPVTLSPLDVEDCADVFHDASSTLRLSLYRFLGTVVCQNASTLSSMLKFLLDNVQRFQCDRNGIFGCIRGLAAHNVDLIESEALSILTIDKRFLRTEFHVNNIKYSPYLALVWNAALQRPELMNRLPRFMHRHINFLRHKYPGSFPLQSWRACDPGPSQLEDVLIKHMTKQLIVIDSNTPAETIDQMLNSVKSQCGPDPGPHLQWLFNLVSILQSAHELVALMKHDYEENTGAIRAAWRSLCRSIAKATGGYSVWTNTIGSSNSPTVGLPRPSDWEAIEPMYDSLKRERGSSTSAQGVDSRVDVASALRTIISPLLIRREPSVLSAMGDPGCSSDVLGNAVSALHALSLDQVVRVHYIQAILSSSHKPSAGTADHPRTVPTLLPFEIQLDIDLKEVDSANPRLPESLRPHRDTIGKRHGGLSIGADSNRTDVETSVFTNVNGVEPTADIFPSAGAGCVGDWTWAARIVWPDARVDLRPLPVAKDAATIIMDDGDRDKGLDWVEASQGVRVPDGIGLGLGLGTVILRLPPKVWASASCILVQIGVITQALLKNCDAQSRGVDSVKSEPGSLMNRVEQLGGERPEDWFAPLSNTIQAWLKFSTN